MFCPPAMWGVVGGGGGPGRSLGEQLGILWVSLGILKGSPGYLGRIRCGSPNMCVHISTRACMHASQETLRGEQVARRAASTALAAVFEWCVMSRVRTPPNASIMLALVGVRTMSIAMFVCAFCLYFRP